MPQTVNARRTDGGKTRPLRASWSIPTACCGALLLGTSAAWAQEPIGWDRELTFHTFSIAAIDPATGESGVAVTTRVPCVGNGVPWVRAGVGAVATQASTRVAYGPELLDALEKGEDAQVALRQAIALDDGRARRQVGVISMDGSSAQHTGDSTSGWSGHRSGRYYVTQGNLLVGPEVLEAVGTAFEASAGSGRHLADRLIEALMAGQLAGGDARKGRLQSAAVVVADPREGMSRRPDGITAHINVCEHRAPVAELRRIYGTISGTLGYRTLEQFEGADVWQLRVMLGALGYFGSPGDSIPFTRANRRFSDDVIEAVDAFRADHGLSTSSVGSPRGLVDDETVDRMWQALEARGATAAVWERLRQVLRVRR